MKWTMMKAFCRNLVWSMFLANAARSLAATPGQPPIPTFNKDVAPILFRSCATCHRLGQSGPFALLTYGDARKHAQQIAEVTASRFMPPWLPEPGIVEFVNERRLSEREIELIQRWVNGGMPEGNPGDLPNLPNWNPDWQLGRPDLVIKPAAPFALRPDGKDVYWNFVIPIPISARRYVRGVEFHPGNFKIVHHAFVNIDNTRASRRLAEKQNPPGFEGMDLPESAHMPGGQLLGWQPGKQPRFSPPGLPWVLEKQTDLVLQLHLHPSGKPELVQPEVGFYFTDQAPTNTAYRVKLEMFTLDIPPGEKDYRVEQSYVLPIDVALLGILPHAHYLGKEMRISAVLPTGTTKNLILIKNWDFNWQGDYAYQSPIELPAGTKLLLNYSYDNSAQNVRNPNRPPKRVRFGLQSTDEMCSCSLQVLPKRPEERNKLAQDFYLHYARVSLDYNEFLIRQNPRDAEAHARAGRALMSLGDLVRAQRHLGEAIRAKPDLDVAYYDLGAIWLSQNRMMEAKRAFEVVVRLNPNDYQAHGNLGFICLRQRQLDEAEQHFRTALQLNPEDTVARKNLEMTLDLRAAQPKN